MRRKNIFYSLLLLSFVVGAPVANANQRAVDHYERGCELIQMGRWSDARVELMKAESKLGVSESLQRQRIESAKILCDANLDLESSRAAIDLFLERNPQAPYHNTMIFQRALLHTIDDEGDQAVDLFKEVDPKRLSAEDRERYTIRMGYLLFEQGDYEQAKSMLSQIGEQSKYYPYALYCRSYIAYVDEEYAVAKSGFETLSREEAFAPVVPYYLMQIEFLTGNYSEAIEYGSKLMNSSTEQDQAEVVRLLAESRFRLKEYKETLSLLDQYVERGGTLGREEQYIKGFSLHQLGWYTQAIEPLKRACGADDEMTQNASFHLANCYLHTGDKSGAKSAFSMAANDKFNGQIAEEALFNYAKLQYELGYGVFNEAVNILTRYITTYDNKERLKTARTLLVAAYYNTRDYAIAYDNIAMIKDPDTEILAAKQKITYLRGLEQYNQGNYSRAAKYLDESIEIGITSKQIALASYWIGEIAFLQGRYSEAVEQYNLYLSKSSKSDPTTDEAQYSIAYAMMMEGNTKSALEYFKRYVTSKNSVAILRADAYSRIGDIHYAARDFDAALLNYNQAILVGVGASNYARYQIAIINGVQGEAMDKISQLKGITSAEEGEEYLDDAMYELGRSYIGVELYKDAIASHKNFLMQYPSSPFYAQALSDLGVAYINIGDQKSSLEYYDKAIKAAPQSQIAKDAMQGIREIYVGSGDAKAYFKYAESIGMEGDLTVVARDSLSFASARGLYFAGDKSQSKMSAAASALDDYVKSYPKGYYVNDALFFLGDSYIKLGDSTKAIETLETLGDRGRSQYSESLYSKLSVMCMDEGEYERSAKASRKLFELVKSRTARYEAMSRYIDALILLENEEVLAAACDEIVALGESKVGADALSKAYYSQATSLRIRGERQAALKIYTILSQGDSSFRSEARYYVIEDSFRAGDKERAKDMIFDFSELEGVDPYWLAKGFILLGDIYVAEEDNFQARATYQSIVDGYTNQSDDVIDEAKRKIGALK